MLGFLHFGTKLFRKKRETEVSQGARPANLYTALNLVLNMSLKLFLGLAIGCLSEIASQQGFIDNIARICSFELAAC